MLGFGTSFLPSGFGKAELYQLSKSPTNATRTRGIQPGSDDGFHTRPARDARDRRRKVAIALAALVLAVAAIFILRATGDRAESVETSECLDLFTEAVCEHLEPPAMP